jgi:hypothetical protein
MAVFQTIIILKKGEKRKTDLKEEQKKKRETDSVESIYIQKHTIKA